MFVHIKKIKERLLKVFVKKIESSKNSKSFQKFQKFLQSIIFHFSSKSNGISSISKRIHGCTHSLYPDTINQ